MTNEEAIIRLKCLPEFYDVEFETDLTALNMAISALEKQIPKKVKYIKSERWYLCPSCGLTVVHSHCEHCGQLLRW